MGPAGTSRDQYSEPILAAPEQWTAVATEVCEEVFVWGGGGEILIDRIREFAENVAKGYEAATGGGVEGIMAAEKEMMECGAGWSRGKVVYVETPRASHEEQIMYYTMRVRDCNKRSSFTSIENWVRARL